MRILFSGASSFTGYWFIQALAQAGHSVTALLQKKLPDYEGIRKKRVDELSLYAPIVEECSFSSAKFFEILSSSSWDCYCHHAADVTGYKDPDFDVVRALANNVGNLSAVLKALKRKGCSKVLLTGSVFEPEEGFGGDHSGAVSAYGLSKGLTSAYFQFYAQQEKVSLGKFVIPNPFGIYEEFRYTSFIAKEWLGGRVVEVPYPRLLRDNVPVSLLACNYVQAVEELQQPFEQWNPSFYVVTGEQFTAKMSLELEKRWQIPCSFRVKEREYQEPLIRTNTDALKAQQYCWNESHFWDTLADYYQEIYSPYQEALS